MINGQIRTSGQGKAEQFDKNERQSDQNELERKERKKLNLSAHEKKIKWLFFATVYTTKKITLIF